MQHGKVYEPIAREKYHSVVFYHLNRDVVVRETGCVVQPYLPWLVAKKVKFGIRSVRVRVGVRNQLGSGLELELITYKQKYL